MLTKIKNLIQKLLSAFLQENKRQIGKLSLPDMSKSVIIRRGVENIPSYTTFKIIVPDDGFIVTQHICKIGNKDNLGSTIDPVSPEYYGGFFNWTGSVDSTWSSNITPVNKGQEISYYFRYETSEEPTNYPSISFYTLNSVT